MTDSLTRQDPRNLVLRHISGAMTALALGAAAHLRLADFMAPGGTGVDDLARRCDVPADRLLRLLRALTSLGLCVQLRPRQFALTDAGTVLRADHPDSLRALTILYTHPMVVQPWTQLAECVRNGRAAFEEIYEDSAFSRIGTDPSLSVMFHTAMSEGTRQLAGILPEHFDFSGAQKIVDVGGGDGTLLAAILRHYPNLTGVVFDTADAIGHAARTLGTTGLHDRCTTVAGDFFDSVPPGADLYLLKSVIHNWDDPRAVTILSRCREAMDAGSRLLIIDPVLPDIATPSDAPENPYLVDLQMMVSLGGKERTREEFLHLCTRAGLSVVNVGALPSDVGYGLVEAVPA